MDKDQQNNWQEKLAPLFGALTLLLIVTSAVMAVEFFNGLKENRFIGRNMEFRNEITVSGEADRFVQPDLAVVSLGVRNEADTVEAAMTENTERMNRVIEAMRSELGIPEKDLKTTQLNLSPRYEWRETRDNGSGERVLVGYEVSQSLQIKIRDFDQVGQVMQQAGSLGANQVGDLVFTLEDETAVKEELRAEAIAQAQAKAETLADQIGVKLVRITGFREDLSAINWPRAAGNVAYDSVAESVPAPSIQPGENKVEVSVSITYEIN
mgnify:CR=1 FL=1|jgi:hypothetical protein